MKKRKYQHIGVTFSLLLLILGMGMIGMVSAEQKTTKALIVVDPGFSNFSYQIAQKIAEQLNTKNISNKIVKVNRFKNEDLDKIDYILIGGPTYMAQPSPKIKKCITSFNNKSGLKAVIFLTGGADESGLEPFIRLVQGKGLTILSHTVIFTTMKDQAEVNHKISKLLETL